MITVQADLLSERLQAQSKDFHPVVKIDLIKDKLIQLDLTANNLDLPGIDVGNYKDLSHYINKKLAAAKAKFAIGGYNENRAIYHTYTLFNPAKQVYDQVNDFPGKQGKNANEERSIHLGIDIWGEAGTRVYAPLGGLIHSFAFNNHVGDYGATLILMHQLDTMVFYTLYGHLSLEDIAKISEFQYVIRGQVIGHFGNPEENGYWPPHLHFQLIKDVRLYKGDYPGVCTPAERMQYLSNCPNPDVVLNLVKYAEG